MEIEELKERISNITNPVVQKEELYEILDKLEIKYVKRGCPKCLRDYLLIAKESVGMIESAAELSSFNGDKEYVYLLNRTFKWKYNGKIFTINKNTPKYIIEEFIKTHKGYYKIKS